jgi:hypothetical protein
VRCKTNPGRKGFSPLNRGQPQVSIACGITALCSGPSPEIILFVDVHSQTS